MDERLEKALDFSNYMITLNSQKRILKEQYREQIMFYHAGSQFTVSKELMTFVTMLVEKGYEEDVVLVDDNEIPVMIEQLGSFLDDIMDVYFSASNTFHAEYEKLKKNRSVGKLTDYE
jgi:hypothetical protein